MQKFEQSHTIKCRRARCKIYNAYEYRVFYLRCPSTIMLILYYKTFSILGCIIYVLLSSGLSKNALLARIKLLIKTNLTIFIQYIAIRFLNERFYKACIMMKNKQYIIKYLRYSVSLCQVQFQYISHITTYNCNVIIFFASFIRILDLATETSFYNLKFYSLCIKRVLYTI